MTAPQAGPTTTTARDVRVRIEPVPGSLDAPDAWAVHGTVRSATRSTARSTDTRTSPWTRRAPATAACCGGSRCSTTPEQPPRPDALEAPTGRGRRLGMLVKVAVLDELARARPSSRRVHTWNAQENAHMLAINDALGFAPASVDAEWQLVLDAAPDGKPERQPDTTS